MNYKKLILILFLSYLNHAYSQTEITWKKHTITKQGTCFTAVAIDVNGDKKLDVIASHRHKVSLFLAPDWKKEIIIFKSKKMRDSAIHSAVLDADGDGDLDWVGSVWNGHPFWLENPGPSKVAIGNWNRRSIDNDITGIHCIIASDVDKDGKEDLIINNFVSNKGLKDSMAWFSRPKDINQTWDRHIFAKSDAMGGSHYMSAADVDGDGWNEIAVGAKGRPFKDGNWFAYWKHPGGENVKAAWEKVLIKDNQVGASNILGADINGDGKTDWFASRGHGRGVIWFENPSWKLHNIDDTMKGPHSLCMGDFDKDGDIDAASCGNNSRSVRWYENDGKGNFKIHVIDGKQASYDLRSIDMDNDGDLDLLNAGQQSRNVVWYENLKINN